MIRELILQMKLGHVDARYFQRQVRRRHSASGSPTPFDRAAATRASWRWMRDDVRLNRDGLLQVDRLLHEFFLPEHRNARYT